MIDSAINSTASSYLPRFEIRVGTQDQGSYDSFKDAMIVAMKLRAIYPAAAITVIDLTSGAAVFDTDGAVLATSREERTNHNYNADIGAHIGELTPLTQQLLNQAQMNGTQS